MAVIALNRPTQSGVVGIPSLPYGGIAVTPSSDHFDRPVAIFVGTGGVVNAVPYANGVGGAGVLVTVASGGFVPFMCVQVLSASTTAADLVAAF